jgi:hypothetical protein
MDRLVCHMQEISRTDARSSDAIRKPIGARNSIHAPNACVREKKRPERFLTQRDYRKRIIASK